MSHRHAKKHKRSKKGQNVPPSDSQEIVRIGSALLDPETQKIVVFTENMLLNQLRRDGPKIEASFDRLCEDDLIQLSALFSKTNGLIYSGLTIASREEDELRIACAQLLMNASNSFGAAVAVLRMGYVLQPGIILRSLLEAVSTALYLIQNPNHLPSYQNHTLQSQKTIAVAKKAVPPLGSLYGHFSDNFAHIGRLHKSITPVNEYSEENDALTVNLSSLRIAAWLLYVTAELLFNELLEVPRYWQAVKQGYMYNPSEEEKAWMKSYFQMEKL
ncbi:DUF5677 domain-containing protein [Chromobacterium violaceum]|uniref:Uncharacterized protein n=1 Tax=Chromobacterium violaceum (strain ATCC 12472 / DSM 30191 / JCM 1249 / CCUG 213 / NBRC 12614 / NCIMB 9131 / NCTC 9757 / MK) TaxID=243365 RepID=Q7NZS8_CHRVO|nr:DUF5677 domain-containing protein [Chromobacterium violaceum]AAQ58518.1 hypothetical protein CV_0843 [Chromobacterium violaceum ATCC 12472]